MKKCISGLVLLALGFARYNYSSLEPLITTSSMQVTQEPTIVSINDISSFVPIKENNTDYFYAVAKLTTEKGNQYNGIIKLDLHGNCDYIDSPSNMNIQNEAHPLVNKIGKQIVLVTTNIRNKRDRIRIYDPSKKTWYNTIYQLPKKFNDKSVEYITGTENKWFIKACDISKPDCQILKVQNLSTSSVLKIERYTGEDKTKANKHLSLFYQEASITPTHKNVWLIGKEEDKFFVEVPEFEDADNTDRSTHITVPIDLNLSAISNFTAVDDTRAFFVDENQKTIYSINEKGYISLCMTTQDPINALGVWNDTLVAAIKTTLYKYVPSLKAPQTDTKQLKTEPTAIENRNTPALDEFTAQQPNASSMPPINSSPMISNNPMQVSQPDKDDAVSLPVEEKPTTPSTLTVNNSPTPSDNLMSQTPLIQNPNAAPDLSNGDTPNAVPVASETHSARTEEVQPASPSPVKKLTEKNVGSPLFLSSLFPTLHQMLTQETLKEKGEVATWPYKKLRNWVTNLMTNFWNKISSLRFH